MKIIEKNINVFIVFAKIIENEHLLDYNKSIKKKQKNLFHDSTEDL